MIETANAVPTLVDAGIVPLFLQLSASYTPDIPISPWAKIMSALAADAKGIPI
jgi:hypothetical protein